LDPSPAFSAPKVTPSQITPSKINSIQHVTPSKVVNIQLLSTPPRKQKENIVPSSGEVDPFAPNNDELDTLSFLGLGSPPTTARDIPASAVKYSSRTQIDISNRPPGLQDVDPLKQYRDTLKQYRNESKLFAKLSTHQRDMVMPLWEEVLPIFPTPSKDQNKKQTWNDKNHE
jgi:hypothetical protein